MSPEIIAAFAGVTGVIGLIAILAYLYIYFRLKTLEKSEFRSVREVVEGQGIFNADQVIEILKSFTTDTKRLAALRTLATVQRSNQASADKVYTQIQSVTTAVDYKRTQLESFKRASRTVFPIFLLLAASSVAYGLATDKNFVATALEQLKEIFVKPAPPDQPAFKTCADPSFGVASWGNTENFEGRSGWRGGGGTQDAYCTEFANSIVGARQLFGKPYTISTVSKSEDSRKIFPGKAEYNYSCTIEVKWNPIYKQQASPLCGVK